jgi:hypothetical protein
VDWTDLEHNATGKAVKIGLRRIIPVLLFEVGIGGYAALAQSPAEHPQTNEGSKESPTLVETSEQGPFHN